MIACARAAATPHLPQEDPEADRQLRMPDGGVLARQAQEREQVVAVSPQVWGQALVGGVRIGREDQVGQLVLQATARHGQTVSADCARRVTITQFEPGPEKLSHTARETNRSPHRGSRHHVGTPQQVFPLK
jgi:hypothetical protein